MRLLYITFNSLLETFLKLGEYEFRPQINVTAPASSLKGKCPFFLFPPDGGQGAGGAWRGGRHIPSHPRGV